MATASHDTHTATHHNAMTPTDHGFRVSEQHVIHLVLARKKILGVNTGTTRIFNRGPTQLMNIATGAKGLLPLTINVNRGNRIILSPLKELAEHDFDHLRVEGIENSGYVQGQTTHLAITLAQG